MPQTDVPTLFDVDGELPAPTSRLPGESKDAFRERTFNAQLAYVVRCRELFSQFRQTFIDRHGAPAERAFYNALCGGGCYCTKEEFDWAHDQHNALYDAYYSAAYQTHSYGDYAKPCWDAPKAITLPSVALRGEVPPACPTGYWTPVGSPSRWVNGVEVTPP